MKKIDYYKVLGIAKDANISDVKQAFRKLALQFHPDRHVGNNSSSSSREAAGHRFKEVSEAYEVLGDEVKRAAYDRAHYHHHHHHHPAGYDRSEGPPKRRYYRRTQEGYTTYGRATESSSTFYGERNNTGGVRWNSELSGPERRERIFNAIFLGVAVPLFLFADHIAESIWPTKKYVGIDLDTHDKAPPQCSRKTVKPAQRHTNDKPAPAVVVSVPRDIGSHRSMIGNSSSSLNYAYMAGTGFGKKLESVKEVALQKMPPNGRPPSYNHGLLDLRSLLMLEGRLSDLKLSELHTWLGYRTWIGVESKRLLGVE
ncbi:unnamed protein product [Sphagnum jensenii]|jgi:curved DNA-binding protein CbpA|uniref:J domain-containing protein n=1 Tax=Sphagnum jensenii TaxID=128206 RepID=A0ABP0WU90_9BRYO